MDASQGRALERSSVGRLCGDVKLTEPPNSTYILVTTVGLSPCLARVPGCQSVLIHLVSISVKLIVVLSGRHWSCITFLVLVVMVVIETVVVVVAAVFVASSWGLFFTMVAARSSEIALRFALEHSCVHTVLNAFPP